MKDEFVADPSGTPVTVARVEHAYDVGGLPTWRHESLMQGRNPAAHWSQEYTHDTLGRLTKARRGKVNNWGTSPTLETTSPVPYVWDWSQTDGAGKAGLDKLGNWNWLRYGALGSELTDDRGHNGANEVTSWTRANREAPTWDDNGNLTCDGRTDHQVFGTSTRLHFEYDYRNHLRRVSDDQDRTVAAYEYDGLNRRVRKTTLDAEESETSDVWYLWSGWQCVEERDLNTAGQPVLRQHVYGPGYVDHHAALVDGQGATYYYLQDRMANVVALADSTGAVVERYAYEPYGGVTITDETGQTVRGASAYGNAYAFTGRYWDAEAGLYYFRNRWYSPDLGRFTSRDPAGYIDGACLYAYVSGKPVMLVDPTGQWGFLGAIAGAVVGGASGVISALANGGGVAAAVSAGVTGAVGGAVACAIMGPAGLGVAIGTGAGAGAAAGMAQKNGASTGAIIGMAVAGGAVGATVSIAGGAASAAATNTLFAGATPAAMSAGGVVAHVAVQGAIGSVTAATTQTAAAAMNGFPEGSGSSIVTAGMGGFLGGPFNNVLGNLAISNTCSIMTQSFYSIVSEIGNALQEFQDKREEEKQLILQSSVYWGGDDDSGGGGNSPNASDPNWTPDWGNDPNKSQTPPPPPSGGNPQPTNDPSREGQPDKPGVDPSPPGGGGEPSEDVYDIEWNNA